MAVIAYFFAQFIYPPLMYWSVILRLFKVDPNKGQVPRDPLLVEKLSPQELVKQAKAKVKARRPITRSAFETYCETFKAILFYTFCCCRTTRFCKSMRLGRGMIRRELDLF